MNLFRTLKKMSILLFFLVTIACNDSFLDRYPLDSLVDENYWETETHLRLSSNASISYLRDKSRTIDMELLGDNVFRERAASYSNIGAGQFTSDLGTLNSEWTYNYNGIRRCNHFLENYNRAQRVDEKIREGYAGENRFIRAYLYTYLVNFFGDVPLITQTIDVSENDEILYGPREEKEKVIEWVLDEFENAGESLRAAKDLKHDEFGRPTKEAAWAFASRFALYHEKWDRAVYFAEKVIESGYHKLYTEGGTKVSYYNLFTYTGRASRNINNKETIAARVYSNDASRGHNLSRELQVPNEEARFSPTRSLLDTYLCNGLPIEVSASGYDESTWQKQFDNRDPRLIQTVLQRLDKWGGNPSNNTYYRHKFKNDAAWSRTTTGWYFKKYVEINAVKTYNKDENDIHLMRYAEVLLNWIEAKQMRGDNISQIDIDNSINLLRKRIGAPEMKLDILSFYGLDLLTEIRRERRMELALEGERYFDILRWKQGDLLAKDVVGIKKSNVHGEETEFAAHFLTDEDGNIILMQGRSFDNPKNYLWPVPFFQVGLNPKLLPNNVGWSN